MTITPIYSIPELSNMLNSKDKADRGAAARRIWTDWDSYNKNKKFLKLEKRLLILYRTEPLGRNSWHYMLSLGLMNSRQAIDDIVDNLTNSKDENIRGFAADALGRYSVGQLPNEVIELLWDLAESDASLVVRVNSIRASSNQYKLTKNESVSKRLLNLMKSQSHSAVQTTIIQQIGEIGSLVLVPELIHIMITRRIEIDKKIAGIALDNIAKANNFSDRQSLINLFKDQL
ncbi:MAG: hypothetical protein HeimC2_08610 [Candidatus Heimdallarchaeota archaeon LC_2]|nr:MAG: hypothetical protein HeimC2_08610 [Candidatus Heimdallarchaeota archaeon LC_2]